MKQPTSIAIVPCHTCSPWVRWFRTASGAWVRQEQHEPHCETFPHVRRSAVAADELGNERSNHGR